jgi:hypothetical protein
MAMKIFADTPEAAERFEELLDLARRNDEVVVCRAGRPIARMPTVSSTASVVRSLLRPARFGGHIFASSCPSDGFGSSLCGGFFLEMKRILNPSSVVLNRWRWWLSIWTRTR